MKTRLFLKVTTACATVILARYVFACTVCIGNPDSDHTKGMNLAILGLLACTAFMLGSFAIFFVVMIRRSRLHAVEEAEHDNSFDIKQPRSADRPLSDKKEDAHA